MRPNILITNGTENGGVHPPEKWAQISADHIMSLFDIGTPPTPGTDDRGFYDARVSDVRRFEKAVVDILVEEHRENQEHVRRKIGDGVEVRDTHGRLQGPTERILAAAQGLSFETAMQRPEVKEHIHAVLHSHFATAMDIEHQWHHHRLAGRAPPEHVALHGKHTNRALAPKE